MTIILLHTALNHHSLLLDAVEVEENLSAIPVVGNREVDAIRPDGVVVMRDVWRFRIFRTERINPVGIDRDAVALQLPVARHGDFLPSGDIIVEFVKVPRPLSRLPDPVELPAAIERFVERRGLTRAYQSRWSIRIRHQRAVGGFLVPVENLRVFPVRNFGGYLRTLPGTRNATAKQQRNQNKYYAGHSKKNTSNFAFLFPFNCQQKPSGYLIENLCTVRCVYFSPGFRTTDGKLALLGESGKCCVSRQKPLCLL
ncbi:hypothetical protein ES703_53706 [subsurface metagenome]